MTSRKQRCLRSFSSVFQAPSSIRFETMPHSSEKNSSLHGTVAREISKIFSIWSVSKENVLSDGTVAAKKVRKIPPICHCARLTQC